MADVKAKTAQIRQAVLGKDVRENIAQGIEAINDQVETTTASEETRVLNESARVTAENVRASNENTRKTSETNRVNAETSRASAENTRVSSENTRLSSEQTRVSSETGRANAETTRVSNEQTRVSSENTRVSNEQARVTAENTRKTSEDTRVSAENTRKTSETNRVNAETSRVNAETTRVSEFNQIKSDYNTASKYNVVTYQDWSFSPTVDTTVFTIDMGIFNPVLDIAELSQNGSLLWEGDNYTRNGAEITLSYTLKAGEKINVRVFKGVINDPPAADGSNLMNGSITKMKLSTDVADKIDKVPVLETQLNDIAISVKAFGAKGDGITNDTQAFQDTLTYALQNNKKMLIPNGKYLVNFVISNCENILIEGNGKTNYYGSKNGGTILKPYDLTKPVITIGDGINQTNNIQIKDINLEGDLTTATSDGLSINGAFHININGISINNFGGDNVKITSSATRFTSYVFFDNCEISRALNSCININFGGTFTTAVYMSNSKIETATTANCKSIILDKANLSLNNVYIQANTSKIGNISLLNVNSQQTILSGYNVTVDSANNTDVLITLDTAADLISNYVQGNILIDGKAEWSDGKQTNLANMSNNVNKPRLRHPLITDMMYFADTTLDKAANDYLDTAKPYLTAQGNTIWIKQGGLAWDNDYTSPLRFISSCLFLNKTTMQLKFYTASKYPVNENSGDTLVTFVPVPATSSSAGYPGQISADANYIYICTAANVWKRIALTSW
jgi:hypothetical protein